MRRAWGKRDGEIGFEQGRFANEKKLEKFVSSHHDEVYADGYRWGYYAARSRSRTAGKGGVRRISTVAGYAWELMDHGADPLKGSDQAWYRTQMIGPRPAQFIGKRKIDGVEHFVFKRDDGVYVAQTAASLK